MIDPSRIFNSRILIVSDQQSNAQLLEVMLQRADYLCITSTMNAAAVCELHLQNHYDLILLDHQKSGKNGFRVLKALEPDRKRVE